MPDHDDLVAAVRRFAPSAMLRALARVSTAQVSRQEAETWPHPWNVALIARESIAYGNEYRTAAITDRDLAYLRELTHQLRDPFADSDRDAEAMESLKVRYSYLQIPFQIHQPLAELARLLAVCAGDDNYYAKLNLESVTDRAWTDLLGVPLARFARCGFVIISLARTNHGQFDVADLTHLRLEHYDVSAAQAIQVFHTRFAAELGDLKARASADRNSVPALRRLDTNPLLEHPFVGLGDGMYVAPSMHLAESRLSLSAVYYLGLKAFGDAFARDMGKLIEAYVGRQLDQLDHDALIPEQAYGKGGGSLTCDWVMSISGVTIIFETKAARIAQASRVGADEHFADMRRDVGKALEKQIPATTALIRDPSSIYGDYGLSREVYGVVVTAEPHLRINRQHYRSLMPDPGVPYVVLSLADLEWFVATALAGLDTAGLIRTLTASHGDPQEVMSDTAEAAGIHDIPPNPLTIGIVTEEVAPSRHNRPAGWTSPPPARADSRKATQ